jgi:glycosyltransferase involved in cell wall biosynthesis
MGDVTAQGKLTIGLPVRNGESYLEAALANLTANTVDGLLIVVSDNASTDATEEIARSASRRDSRIVYHRQPVDVGANRNFNDLARRCTTPLFKWAAVDDLVDPDLLGRCVDALEADHRLALAYGAPRLIDADGAELVQEVEDRSRAAADQPLERFRDVLANEVWCTPIFGVIRHDLLARTALLRPFYGADKVLLAELSLLGTFRRVEPRFYRRCHQDQSTVLDSRAKARWSTGRNRADRMPAVLRATGAYAAVALGGGGGLTVGDRARALGAVGSLMLRGDKLRKLVLPGPYNYFGWRGRTGHAYDALDLRTTGRVVLGGEREPGAGTD